MVSMLWSISRTRSSVRRYFDISIVRRLVVSPLGRVGSSWKERWAIVTSPRPSNDANAFSRRRFPRKHHGQTTSDQMSMCIAPSLDCCLRRPIRCLAEVQQLGDSGARFRARVPGPRRGANPRAAAVPGVYRRSASRLSFNAAPARVDATRAVPAESARRSNRVGDDRRVFGSRGTDIRAPANHSGSVAHHWGRASRRSGYRSRTRRERSSRATMLSILPAMRFALSLQLERANRGALFQRRLCRAVRRIELAELVGGV